VKLAAIGGACLALLAGSTLTACGTTNVKKTKPPLISPVTITIGRYVPPGRPRLLGVAQVQRAFAASGIPLHLREDSTASPPSFLVPRRKLPGGQQLIVAVSTIIGKPDYVESFSPNAHSISLAQLFKKFGIRPPSSALIPGWAALGQTVVQNVLVLYNLQAGPLVVKARAAVSTLQREARGRRL
jgi:hypothetical protein